MLQFYMLLHKIQRKIFNMNKFWVFSKFALWNLKFSYIFRLSPSYIKVEKWKKFWVVYVCYRIILEQCGWGKKRPKTCLRNIWMVPNFLGNFEDLFFCHLNWRNINMFAYIFFKSHLLGVFISLFAWFPQILAVNIDLWNCEQL